jgi:hypothetical protein
MHRLLAGFFVLTLVLAGGYWFRVAESKCNVPVTYDIGSLDERFGLSREEARAAISDAESLWENATGENLFTYTEGADFTINFVYDDRQETTDEEGEIRDILESKEEMSAHIREEYDGMLGKYAKLEATYNARVEDYEAALQAYNDEVELWNKKGGAPESVYADLEKTKARLDEESRELSARARELNQVVDTINALSEEGSEVVRDYNSDVTWYNTLFGGEREFTQGDYQGDRINIYQFGGGDELRQVLAHELGHALSLGHVEEERSIMYHLMEGGLADLKLSSADLSEFHRVCGAD